jgi:hypothetical protein
MFGLQKAKENLMKRTTSNTKFKTIYDYNQYFKNLLDTLDFVNGITQNQLLSESKGIYGLVESEILNKENKFPLNCSIDCKDFFDFSKKYKKDVDDVILEENNVKLLMKDDLGSVDFPKPNNPFRYELIAKKINNTKKLFKDRPLHIIDTEEFINNLTEKDNFYFCVEEKTIIINTKLFPKLTKKDLISVVVSKKADVTTFWFTILSSIHNTSLFYKTVQF